MSSTLRLRPGSIAPNVRRAISLPVLISRFEAELEGDYDLHSFALLLRAAYLVLAIRRYFLRISSPSFSPAEVRTWQVGMALFLVYVLGLAYLWALKRPVFESSTTKRLTIALDVLFFAFFFLLNRDPSSELYLVFWLPLYIAARHLGFTQALYVAVYVIGVMGVVFLVGFHYCWTPPIVQGE